MYNIVRLEERHLPQVVELEKLCFSTPWSEESLRGELRGPFTHYFAAEDESGRVLGYAGMQAILDEGYITNIVVSPSSRRLGIASALLNALMDLGRTKKLSFLTLEVRESNNAAISLYRKFGFMVVGRRKNYYEKPREDALLMTYSYKYAQAVERNESLDNNVG